MKKGERKDEIYKSLDKDQLHILLDYVDRRAERFLNTTRGQTAVNTWFMVRLGLVSGLRIAEIAHCQHDWLRTNGKYMILTVKKGKRTRSKDRRDRHSEKVFKKRQVYLPLAFQEILNIFTAWKEKNELPTHGEAPLLCHNGGSGYSPRGLMKVFKKAIQGCGIEDADMYSSHSMRHSALSLLYSKTKDLRLVMNNAGHTSLQVTSKYQHLNEEDKAAVNNLSFE